MYSLLVHLLMSGKLRHSSVEMKRLVFKSCLLVNYTTLERDRFQIMPRLHGIDPGTLSLIPRLLIMTWACVVSKQGNQNFAPFAVKAIERCHYETF